jgi:hypothetical protein
MARPADPRKSAAWQRRLRRFTASGISVSKFCDRAGVSVAAFHYWRRRLRHEQPEQVALPAAPVFQKVDVLSQQAVVVRFTAGGIMEIPGDRADLVRVASLAMAAEPQPC